MPPTCAFAPDETFDRLDETRRLFSDPAVQRDLAARSDGRDRRLTMRLLLALLRCCAVPAGGAGRDLPGRDALKAPSYTLCEVTLADDLRLFHSGADGAYGSFAARGCGAGGRRARRWALR